MVREFANSLNIAIEEYFTQVKLAMLNHSSDFVYDLKTNGSSASFKWIKKEGTIKILHGSVELSKDEPATSKDALIEALLFKNENLERELDDVKKINHNLNNELTTSRDELKKIANSQSELEKVLYAKFVQLLNTKKERIRVLEGCLSKYE
ncbi:hypothetical protein EVAR_6140_1 [Eumeta japonica]|uniref:DNA repair protein XRCC4 n=1 Tax=Eumeta variegata TaxID=151549 RepID=A0A4C1TE62_EUMVA|nr:hypothetical protein EVAR_6140_1 [Eumeta japonica]